MLALLHDPGTPHGLRLDFEAARVRGGATIEAFGVGAWFGPDLAYLAALLADVDAL